VSLLCRRQRRIALGTQRSLMQGRKIGQSDVGEEMLGRLETKRCSAAVQWPRGMSAILASLGMGRTYAATTICQLPSTTNVKTPPPPSSRHLYSPHSDTDALEYLPADTSASNPRTLRLLTF
jgi:hypothetical protein